MTVMRSHQISLADITQCANLPLEDSTSFDIFAGTNPSDDDALGDTYWFWKVTDDFDEQHESVQQQMDSDLATTMLREIIGEDHLLRLDAPPNIYSRENRVGDGSLHHDPRYRFDPVFGPQPV